MQIIGADIGPMRTELEKIRSVDRPTSIQVLLIVALFIGIGLIAFGIVFIISWQIRDAGESMRAAGAMVLSWASEDCASSAAPRSPAHSFCVRS